MKNQKLIIGAFITLVVLNIALIAIIFFGRPGGSEHPGPRGKHVFHHHKGNRPHGPGGPGKGLQRQLSLFSEELDLDNEQEKKFSTEIDSFHTQMRKIMGEKKVLKKQLLQPGNTGDQNALLDKIAAAERAGAALEVKHFSTLKALLNEDQKTKFDTLVSRMNSFRGPRGGHSRRGPRE